MCFEDRGRAVEPRNSGASGGWKGEETEGAGPADTSTGGLLKPMLDFQPRTCQITNLCCLKPLSLGGFVAAAVGH